MYCSFTCLMIIQGYTFYIMFIKLCPYNPGYAYPLNPGYSYPLNPGYYTLRGDTDPESFDLNLSSLAACLPDR